MADAHTPGPWHRDRTSGVSCDVRAENGRKVALCWGLSTSKAAQMNTPAYKAECDANANLIAAAPETAAERDRLREINAELLAALEEIADELEAAGGYWTDTRRVEAIRAALSKATGQGGET